MGGTPVIEWEPGSNVVGDFTWMLLWDPIVTSSTRRAIETHHLSGFQFGSVEMVQHPRVKKPTRMTRRTRRRIYLPYEGPELFSTVISHSVPIEETLSTVIRHVTCVRCGRFGYDFIGIEHIEYGKWTPGKEIERIRVPRVPGQGLYVLQKRVAGFDFFRLGGPGFGVACTERARLAVLEAGLSNIDFFEVGDVVEG